MVQLVNPKPGPALLVLCWDGDCGAALNPCSEVHSELIVLIARVFHVPRGTCVLRFPEAHPAFLVLRGKIFSKRVPPGLRAFQGLGQGGKLPPGMCFWADAAGGGEEVQDQVIRAVRVGLPAQTGLVSICSGTEEWDMGLGTTSSFTERFHCFVALCCNGDSFTCYIPISSAGIQLESLPAC